MPGYSTIAEPVTAELEIKRSTFLAVLTPVAHEDEARAVIAAVRAEHPRARHHCTAFVLGGSQQIQRTNDDGEPSGTAGAPMLDALVSAGLSDVVAVVVRYFGGVLLGASGLTRAYRAAVAEAIAAAQIRFREERVSYRMRLAYAEAAALEVQAQRHGWQVQATWAEQVGIELWVPEAEDQAMMAAVAALTAGRVIPERLGTVWTNGGTDA